MFDKMAKRLKYCQIHSNYLVNSCITTAMTIQFLIKATRRKSYGFEYRTPGSWLLSPSTTLVTFTLAKLAIIGVTEDQLDFEQIKARQHSSTFLKNLKNHLVSIPEDCREGLKELGLLLGKQLDWNQNILPACGALV